MKLTDGIKLKGRPVEIPDCSRDDLPSFFVDMGFKLGAEIGVDRGDFSVQLCEAGLIVYAIDSWAAHDDYHDATSQERLDSIFRVTKKRLSSYPHCRLIRKTSMEAAQNFADRSLDFVYIDGNHQLMYIIQDLVVWSRKVKVGGIISGHDYIYTSPRTQAGMCHVIQALHAYTHAYSINDWYLLGRRKRIGEEKRDRFRSWMFINQEFKLRDG